MVAQTVKNLPAMQETCVQTLSREDLLEKGMATCSNIFAWKIPWTEEADGLQFMESQRVGRDWTTNTQLLQNIGNIPHVAQYTLEPILHTIVCATNYWVTDVNCCIDCFLQPVLGHRSSFSSSRNLTSHFDWPVGLLYGSPCGNTDSLKSLASQHWWSPSGTSLQVCDSDT